MHSRIRGVFIVGLLPLMESSAPGQDESDPDCRSDRDSLRKFGATHWHLRIRAWRWLKDCLLISRCTCWSLVDRRSFAVSSDPAASTIRSAHPRSPLSSHCDRKFPLVLLVWVTPRVVRHYVCPSLPIGEKALTGVIRAYTRSQVLQDPTPAALA